MQRENKEWWAAETELLLLLLLGKILLNTAPFPARKRRQFLTRD
jgi:hypothetical protein